MTYKEFKTELTNLLYQKLQGRNVQIEFKGVIKSNDCRKEGIIILEEDNYCAPMVYLDDLYEYYRNGETIEDITLKIIEMHDENKGFIPEEVQEMENFEYAKDYITCRAVNTRINQAYLEDVPHIDYLDLSLVFYCTYIVGDPGHVLSSKINREIMDSWHVDVHELYERAKCNTPRMLGIYLKEVREIFLDMMGNAAVQNEELYEAINDQERSPMYILSNLPRNSGAVNIFMDGVLHSLAETLEDDLYIIPSSIHEVLLIPMHGRLSRPEIDEMVHDVNRNVLSPQDILSNHVYLYSREEDRISM